MLPSACFREGDKALVLVICFFTIFRRNHDFIFFLTFELKNEIIYVYYLIKMKGVEMKTYISILIFLFVAIPCFAAEKGVEIQQQRLTDLEQYVTEQRQQVEQWYSNRVAELNQFIEDEADKRFTHADRILWTEFLNILSNKEYPYEDAYFLKSSQPFFTDKNGLKPFFLDREGFKVRNAMINQYFLKTTAEHLKDGRAYNLLIDVLKDRYRNVENGIYQNYLIRKVAYKLKALMEEYHRRSTRIENLKYAKIAELERWESDIKEHIFRTIEQIKSQPAAPQVGVVSAISFDGELSFCMIEGVERILKEGDVINNEMVKNVKIAGIERTKVEFEKNGRLWEQVIGKPANSLWQN